MQIKSKLPHVTNISATLKTAKSMNVNSNISTTYPEKIRSIQLPNPPIAINKREYSAITFLTLSEMTTNSKTIVTSSVIIVKNSVCPFRIEKAAPVFSRYVRLNIFLINTNVLIGLRSETTQHFVI